MRRVEHRVQRGRAWLERMRARRWFALVGCAVALTTARAHAGGVAILAVDIPSAPAEARQVRAALRRAVLARGLTVIDDSVAVARARVRAGAVPRATLERFSRVRALLRDGWRAYIAADLDIASTTLSAAAAACEPILALDGAARLYADISLRQGVVSMRRGDRPAAERAFTVARALDSTRQLSLTAYPPEVIQAYERATPAPGTASVSIRVHPESAHVFMDDRPVPAASSAITLALAPHLIVARAPGYRAHAHLWRPGDDPNIDLHLQPEPRAHAILNQPIMPMLPSGTPAATALALEGLIVYADVDAVVVAASVWRGHQPALIAQRCVGLPVQCTSVSDIRYVEHTALVAAAAELWAVLTDADPTHPLRVNSDPTLWPARTTPPVTAKRATRPRDRCRWCRNPWVWAGAGVLATVAVTTALVLTADSSQTPVITLDPCEFGNCER